MRYIELTERENGILVAMVNGGIQGLETGTVPMKPAETAQALIDLTRILEKLEE